MNLCACMGPMRGDPHCYCKMVELGLTPTPPSQDEVDRFNKALEYMFKNMPLAAE